MQSCLCAPGTHMTDVSQAEQHTTQLTLELPQADTTALWAVAGVTHMRIHHTLHYYGITLNKALHFAAGDAMAHQLSGLP